MGEVNAKANDVVEVHIVSAPVADVDVDYELFSFSEWYVVGKEIVWGY